ncbi:Crp/Fnr family transcriptional regulator [candidate division KSB1 bacterium]
MVDAAASASADRQIFIKGELIFKEGDRGREMYIIERGRVKVEMKVDKNKSVVLGEFGPKNFFGEMALFGDQRRTGTATAMEDTLVVIIHKTQVQKVMSTLPPWFVKMFSILIQRLKETDLRYQKTVKSSKK